MFPTPSRSTTVAHPVSVLSRCPRKTQALWTNNYVYGHISRSPGGLEKAMAAIVTAFNGLGGQDYTVPANERWENVSFNVAAAGQMEKTHGWCCVLGQGCRRKSIYPSVEATRRIQKAYIWACFERVQAWNFMTARVCVLSSGWRCRCC